MMYEVYCEVLCYFHICDDVHRRRGIGLVHLTWARYLFLGMDQGDIKDLLPCGDSMIATRAHNSPSNTTYATKSLEGGFALGTTFQIFHHQAKRPTSNTTFLEG